MTYIYITKNIFSKIVLIKKTKKLREFGIKARPFHTGSKEGLRPSAVEVNKGPGHFHCFLLQPYFYTILFYHICSALLR